MNFDTQILHAGISGDIQTGATLTPIYQSSAFGRNSAEEIERIFNNKASGFAYTRISNPTVAAFESRITEIEKGFASVATSSGMSAISMTLLNILSSGDELISTTSVFGGTLDLYNDLKNFGIKVRFVEEITEEELSKVISSKTKAVFAETIGNPKLNVINIKESARIIHKFNLPFILDNTIATPYLIKGIEFGADIIINSTSKYINGSSNSIGGIITDSGNYKWSAEKYSCLNEYIKFGKFAFVARLRNDIYRNFGSCISPANAFLNLLGLETLSLRMQRHCKNAHTLASFLENQEGIRSVNYPSLKSSDYSEITNNQFGGKGSGIFTIRLYTKERAFEFINRLKYAIIITNIGDTKTLVVHPASTIYAHSDKETQEKAGVYEDLIRVSVGIEDIEDLKEDFLNALNYINKEYPL